MISKDNTFQVSNLSEYVSLLNRIKVTNVAFYRGENKFYKHRIASAFRPNQSGVLLFEFEKLVYVFYREVYNSIFENDKKHFMAFAQHHFIPTNLIDITTNPLSALWFACDGGDEDEDGFVYCFDNTYIDITDFISENIMEFDVIRRLFLVPETKKLTTTQRDLFSCIINNAEFYDNYRKVLNNDIYGEKDIKEINKLLDDCEAIFITHSITPSILKHIDVTATSLFLKIYKLDSGMIFRIVVNILPNLLYNPILTFERAVKQNSCFFYQSYYYNSSLKDFEKPWSQKIKVYSTIKIRNRKKNTF
jgi:hypothetical protein